jgi:glycosyltransferase involved in cell wall biosynthesis
LNAYRQQKSSGVQLPPIVLVGGAGWKDRTLLQQLEAGKAAGDVLALGYVDLTDLPALYATSEVFLMPSIYEGFGMPLLEAQLCGVPVVHGQHASMVEASAGLGVAVNTSLDGLALMLQQLFNGQLPLACRLFDRFPLPSVDEAAQTLWQQILSAHAAAQHAT